jgi:hypothetical protein
MKHGQEVLTSSACCALPCHGGAAMLKAWGLEIIAKQLSQVPDFFGAESTSI